MAERLTGINLQRIKWCSREYGIAHDELASRLRMPAILKLADDGDRGLTYRQLRIVAAFFGREPEFFLEEGPASRQTAYSPQFRTLAGQLPELGNDANHLIRLVEHYRELYEVLREDFDDLEDEGPWDSGIANGGGATAPELARRARRWLGVDAGGLGFDQLRELVESRGILVFLTTGHRGRALLRLEAGSNVRGFSVYDEQTPVIVVKKMPNWGTSRGGEHVQSFTLMHELGHLLLHRDSFITAQDHLFSRRKKEREANRFAANLLVPGAQLRRIDPAGLRGLDGQMIEGRLKPLAAQWGVNTMVIALRLLEEGVITARQYASYERYKRASYEPLKSARAGGGSRNRAKETLAMFGRRYTYAILHALGARQITLHRASSYLGNLDTRHFRDLMSEAYP